MGVVAQRERLLYKPLHMIVFPLLDSSVGTGDMTAKSINQYLYISLRGACMMHTHRASRAIYSSVLEHTLSSTGTTNIRSDRSCN